MSISIPIRRQFFYLATLKEHNNNNDVSHYLNSTSLVKEG